MGAPLRGCREGLRKPMEVIPTSLGLYQADPVHNLAFTTALEPTKPILPHDGGPASVGHEPRWALYSTYIKECKDVGLCRSRFGAALGTIGRLTCRKASSDSNACEFGTASSTSPRMSSILTSIKRLTFETSRMSRGTSAHQYNEDERAQAMRQAKIDGIIPRTSARDLW